MNVSTINDAQEYRASMQRAALTFLQRHQGEHLTDDGHLFARAVSYLVNGLDVPTFMADRLVHLAMSELECRKRTAIGISYGTDDATRVALRSFFSGEAVLIPLRHLPARLQPPAAPLAAAATH
ncbi:MULTISPECIES: hypothetical protein [Stutzerimonas]|uniref:hypothetical protein n=1 Tax=Stutzerimonas TaxID=2901164 RepID=UPI000CE4B44B|nr:MULTISPECIES: hypothetical protein [Stutzerimonas]MDH1587987.1 hypothetical protein [Stutzerimonas stutzeri]MDL2174693.1 hypothetical protein [Stutzerimonas sp. FeSN7]